MARQKLTAERIRNFVCPKGSFQAFLWDSEVPGLGVRVTPGSGVKMYIFQGRLSGKTIRMKIGDVRTWLLDNKGAGENSHGARQEARRLQSLLDQGIDPRIERQERVVEQETKREEIQRSQTTVGDAWAVYLEERQNHWSPRHYADHMRVSQAGGQDVKRGKGKTKAGPLSPLMELQLSELTPNTIRTWAGKEAAKRGTQTRIAFDALRAFINWCNDHPDYRGLASLDACSSRVRRETIPKKRAKDDCLQREQLPAWFKAVRDLSNPVISAYLQALLLTGARREELAMLKWSDVDFKWMSMTIRDKVEGERTIPLTPYVAHLLKPLPRRTAPSPLRKRARKVEWVFSSPTAESHRLQEPRIPHNRALNKAGIEGLTLHGLRRSFGTLSEWLEVPAGVVAQIMGHKPSATVEKHYRRRPIDLLRMWHEKIEVWILEQAGIELPKESRKIIQIVKN